MAFWIPMLSGKAAFKGYNNELMLNHNVGWYPPGTYGFSYYYKSNYDPCRSGATILMLTYSLGELKESRFNCLESYK